MSKGTRNRVGFIGWIGLAAALCFAPFGLLHSEQIGRCAEAFVPEPIVLPDGTHHPASSLRICYSRAHSPVAGLHEVRINGHAVGLFASRLGWSEAAEKRPEPFFVFRRALDGDLVLEAYAWPVGKRMRIFQVDPSRYDSNPTAIAASKTFQNDRSLVLVAARR